MRPTGNKKGGSVFLVYFLSSYCSLEIHEMAGALVDMLPHEVTLKMETTC